MLSVPEEKSSSGYKIHWGWVKKKHLGKIPSLQLFSLGIYSLIAKEAILCCPRIDTMPFRKTSAN